MFWADKIADEVERRYADVIKAGEPLVVRDEKTASGRVHVGSLRSASLHAIVADILKERGHDVVFKFEINDFDPMDGIPGYLDENEWKEHLGKPLYTIPSPEEGYDNFAELYGQEYVKVLDGIGFGAEVYRASELYKSGQMNDVIRKALERRDVVRKIYFDVSKSEKPEDWYPLNVICEECGKLSTTKVTGFDGSMVSYTCEPECALTPGCGHTGLISPFDGNAKLPWKLDWAAKFAVLGVHFEGGGKDHYTKGGSRQVAEAIARDVFDVTPPYGVFNEFFLVGGKKMSSSKGNAATAVEMAELLPPQLLRLLLLKSPINRQLNFDPEGDAVPVLFDTFDRYAEKFHGGTEDDDARTFVLSHLPDERKDITKHFMPRFSQIAFLVQMPHMHIAEEVAKMKEADLNDDDIEELSVRAKYAKHWLEGYADEQFIYKLQDTVPPLADTLTEEQKAALASYAEKIKLLKELDGWDLHQLTHQIKEESGLSPKEFFTAIYILFLGKESGPKVGWLLSTLEKDFVVKRLLLKG